MWFFTYLGLAESVITVRARFSSQSFFRVQNPEQFWSNVVVDYLFGLFFITAAGAWLLPVKRHDKQHQSNPSTH